MSLQPAREAELMELRKGTPQAYVYCSLQNKASVHLLVRLPAAGRLFRRLLTLVARTCVHAPSGLLPGPRWDCRPRNMLQKW